MKALCPIWPRSAERAEWILTLSALTAAGLLAACLVLPLGAFIWAERSEDFDLEAFAGSDAALQDAGPLAPVFVEVNARGWAFTGGRRVNPPALRDLLRRALRILPGQEVVFRINEATPSEYLGPFLEACTAAGIRHVQIVHLK